MNTFLSRVYLEHGSYVFFSPKTVTSCGGGGEIWTCGGCYGEKKVVLTQYKRCSDSKERTHVEHGERRHEMFDLLKWSHGGDMKCLTFSSGHPETKMLQMMKKLKNGSQIVELKNGYQIDELKNGSQIVELKNGYQIVELKNGIQIVELKNGYQIVEPNNGSQIVELKNGSQIIELKNGYQIVELKNGSQIDELKNSTQIDELNRMVPR
ncbi:hypothetical protein Bpfe_029093 [Biomphalaria pfeifferi]|uniref:Uncharacterized protein n=1 Tax=Biomphalaria pfeifferi TaxID=112525 RepID=A0AAD8EWM0_BIOPF|nr:hypothetical protein Bpfe_029093 [Biomphalaria pfeifferi]